MSLITVLAHEGETVLEIIEPSLSEVVRNNQINFTLLAAVALILLTILAVILTKIYRKSLPVAAQPIVETEVEENGNALWKTVLFICMVLVILANSAYLVGSTLYINAKSVTGGPVHWHADFEVWYCGEEIELVDPIPPSNRVGSPLLHEHNDKEIHVEEAVFDKDDVTLGAFFKVVGGDLHESENLKFPTNSGVVETNSGDICPDGTPAQLQVFLYKAGSFKQQILENAEDYLMTPEQKVPPGDCIIFEFGPQKNQTEHLCQSYEVAKEKHNGH